MVDDKNNYSHNTLDIPLYIKCISRKQGSIGFTLTELIVVISILAILGLIAFISIAGYVSSARDAVRASDISNLSQGIELVATKNGTYPTPDNAFIVTYSGGSVWSQGTAGNGVF